MSSIVRDVISKYPESLQKLVTLNDKVYALPADISPAVLWYRKDIFNKYGIKSIDTWNQYNAAAQTLKKDGIYIMPIFNPAGPGDQTPSPCSWEPGVAIFLLPMERLFRTIKSLNLF
jgi:multiple sugar transport system substrate-binding protein